MKEPVARSLEYWARVRARELALHDGETSLTYREWNEYADMLADAFTGRGLGFDDVIAVRCSSRIEWAVIALAAAKIDARLFTLQADLPMRAARQRIIDAHVSAIIVGDVDPATIAPALEGLPLRLRATLDVLRPGFYNFYDLFPPAAPQRFSRAQPSLISWTRGETGKAQPVGLPRRVAAPASRSRAPMPEQGCSLITVPLHRVWGPVQFWAALDAGRAIAFMREFDPHLALQTIERHRVSHWSALPNTLHQLAALPERTIRAHDLSSMRDLTVGGDAVDYRLKSRLTELLGPIVNEAYGSTEAGLITFMPARAPLEKPGSCGRPLKGVMVEIRDGRGRRLPPHATGEIWARTPRSLSCELMGPDTRRDADGFVATADFGRLDEDGFLYITGRASAQEVRAAG
ncbi:MAG: AMP-binding protein [Hyphomonadaceae bacterium]|nr:AMP-binding protein [Hyphomonadaceae bacterium]